MVMPVKMSQDFYEGACFFWGMLFDWNVINSVWVWGGVSAIFTWEFWYHHSDFLWKPTLKPWLANTAKGGVAHVILSLTPASLLIIIIMIIMINMAMTMKPGRNPDLDDHYGPGSNPDQNNPQDRGLRNERQHNLTMMIWWTRWRLYDCDHNDYDHVDENLACIYICHPQGCRGHLPRKWKCKW